jgi:hypothetical protein
MWTVAILMNFCHGQHELEKKNYFAFLLNIVMMKSGMFFVIASVELCLESGLIYCVCNNMYTVKNPVLIRHALRHTNPTVVRVESTRDFFLCRFC